jgi:hypothetical protein
MLPWTLKVPGSGGVTQFPRKDNRKLGNLHFIYHCRIFNCSVFFKNKIDVSTCHFSRILAPLWPHGGPTVASYGGALAIYFLRRSAIFHTDLVE